MIFENREFWGGFDWKGVIVLFRGWGYFFLRIFWRGEGRGFISYSGEVFYG